MINDNRSRKFAFVPFCLMCQAFQAQGIVKYNWKSNITPIIQKLIDNDINIIQMPCPESSFGGYSESLVRQPMGLKGYDTKEYNKHCEELCISTLDMIEALLKNNYEVICILGIENSPSCAVSYIYTNKGMQNRKGVFFDCLEKKLTRDGIVVPFIGINRKSVNIALKKLDELLKQ